jgi:ABC-type Fe3+/spermidine/putrescine transport system ATPase subunit
MSNAEATKPSDTVPAIELVGIAKHFQSRRGVVAAVEQVDLVIGEGEFFSLLGPSGCGKTTTLRMIGGFEEPTEGRILLYGDDVVGVAPNHRDVNMVFQSYALFPHMNVFENVAFGLKRKSVERDETNRRVNEMLDLVQLDGKSDRMPRELSGGQQQRVALARALVNRPRALLLDEPLAALDLKLRQTMQLELKRIQREVGITFVFVTHDQEEALTMSDRLVVLNAGRIEQLGTPIEVYERPASEFVAGFIGVSNLLERGGRRFTIRPEKVRLSDAGVSAPAGHHAEGGRIDDVIYLGMVTRYVVELDAGGTLIAVEQNRETAAAEVLQARGRHVSVSWRDDQTFEIGKPAAAGAEAQDDINDRPTEGVG